MNDVRTGRTLAAGLALRPTEEADLAAIAAIYAHHVETGAASFELEPPGHAEMLRRWRAIVESGYPYLTAEEGGEVVGYAYASAYRTRPAYRHTVENSVYVRADRHGRGIGRLLLERLIEDCAGRGFRQMIAVIGDNAPASIALHAGLGFELVGRLRGVGFKFARWCDTTLMQRDLGPGQRSPPG
jgi:L-amino acid N-acyltransferase YncA